MEIVDPFASGSNKAQPIVDPFAGIKDPFASKTPRTSSLEADNNTALNAAGDVVRGLLSPAVTGFNAIGTALGQKLAGGSAVEGLVEGGKKESFLGFDLQMKTDAGKWVEEKLGSAFETMREFGGENAVKLLTNPTAREILKATPYAPLVHIYENADQDGKISMEAALNAAGASAGDIALILLGGKGAKSIEKAVSKEVERPVSVTELLAEAENKERSAAAIEAEAPPPKPVDPLSYLTPDDHARLSKQIEGLELEPIQQLVDERKPADNLIDFEKVSPEELRTQQEGIQFPTENEVQFSERATPEQGLDWQQTQQFDDTPNTEGRIPTQLPLGGMQAFKGQRGSVGTYKPKSLEEQAKHLSKDEWIAEFNKQYPGKEKYASQVWDSLNEQMASGPSFKFNTEFGGEALKALDKGLGALSTRIGNISQPVLHRAIKFEQAALENTHKRIEAGNKFLYQLNQLSPTLQKNINNLLLNNNLDQVRNIASKFKGNMASDFDRMIKSLQETGKELRSTGRVIGLRENYFPRIVTDVKGLLNELGFEHRTELEKRLLKAGTDAEQSAVINSYLRGNYRSGTGRGYSKSRKIEEIPPELEKYYASPTEAFHTYMRNATQDIEMARFFGKDAIKDPTTGRVNVDQSIGNLVLQELKDGKISAEQASDLQSMLESRFGPGNQGANPLLQDVKNIINAGLLGNIPSALTQLADAANAAYLNGFRPTLMAMATSLAGKNKVSLKEFGLLDHISEEFTSTRKSARALRHIFKGSLFSAVDNLGKNTILNSSLINSQKLAQTTGGMEKLRQRWGERFGDEFPKLVNDLRKGELTDTVRVMLFSDLSKVQPVSRLELPQKYLDMPNGRVIYMLKSFMLKQMDLIRNDAFNQLKKGNVAEGIGNLARYTLILGSANASVDYIKNWIMGRDFDPELSDIPLNVLKTFGWSEFVQDKIKQGRVGEALGDVALPPYKMFDTLFKDAIAATNDDPFSDHKYKSVNYLPAVGKLYYNWYMGGAEEYNDREEERKTRELFGQL